MQANPISEPSRASVTRSQAAGTARRFRRRAPKNDFWCLATADVHRVPRLLVVEDDAELWPVIKRIAATIEPDVWLDFERSAEAALELICNVRRYDAVLADGCLAGEHEGGWLRLRCERFQPGALFAMMSAYPRQEIVNDVSFLPKPFTIDEGQRFLRRLLPRNPRRQTSR